MTVREKEYLNRRLHELYNKKIQLNIQIRKTDKEIASIIKKLGEEIETKCEN